MHSPIFPLSYSPAFRVRLVFYTSLLVSLLSSLFIICCIICLLSVAMPNGWQNYRASSSHQVRFNLNNFPSSSWKHKLVGGFLTRMNKNSWIFRNALSYRWCIEGGFSVSKFSRFYYLIKFESRLEMFRVLRQGTRIVFGDIFMIQQWNPYLNPRIFSMNSEVFDIILHNLTPNQTHFLNVKNNTSELGELIYCSAPNPTQNGFSSMSIRLRINLSQPLISETSAPNEFYEENRIAFQYLELAFLQFL